MTRLTNAGDAAGASAGNFPAFLASLFLSKVADQVLLFLVPLVVFQETRQASLSGLAFAIEAFPRFVSFPVCGALCDRASPVHLTRWSQVLRAVVCLACVAGAQWHGGVVLLIAASAVCGVLTTQGAIAREVMLPQAFAALKFEKVLAYTQAADQVGAVLGPLAAAALLSASSWTSVLTAAAAIFIASDVALELWRRSATSDFSRGAATRHGGLAAMSIALRHIAFTPGLRKLVVQAAGVNLVVGVTLASSAAMCTGIHHQSAGYFAVLQAAGAVVTVAILLVVAHVNAPIGRFGTIAYLVLILGGILTAASGAPWGYAAGYLAVIGFDKMFNIYLRSTRQKLIPMADYGKTTGLMTLLNNLTQPVAGVAVGLLAARTSLETVILLVTIAMALLGLASFMASNERRAAPGVAKRGTA